jgi:hypothetical protein
MAKARFSRGEAATPAGSGARKLALPLDWLWCGCKGMAFPTAVQLVRSIFSAISSGSDWLASVCSKQGHRGDDWQEAKWVRVEELSLIRE